MTATHPSRSFNYQFRVNLVSDKPPLLPLVCYLKANPDTTPSVNITVCISEAGFWGKPWALWLRRWRPMFKFKFWLYFLSSFLLMKTLGGST